MQQYYNPDKWVIVGIEGNYKVLGGWSGGYLDGDSWRLSSGLVKIEEDSENSDYYLMHNHSGSIYKCHKNAEGTNFISAGILAKFLNIGAKQITVEEFNKVENESDNE